MAYSTIDTYTLEQAVSSPQKISLMHHGKSRRQDLNMMSPVPKTRLERSSESLPKLESNGRASEMMQSRRSGIGAFNNSKLNLNHSME